MSYFVPSQLSVFFSTLDSQGNARLDYVLTPKASFQFHQGKPTLVDLTSAVGIYPFSGAMVNVLVVALEQYRNQIQQMPTQTPSLEQQ